MGTMAGNFESSWINQTRAHRFTSVPFSSRNISFNILPHLNETYGIEMAQNGAFGGTPDVVYQEDAGVAGDEWDTSALIGTWDFDSTNDPKFGTYCIEASEVENGDIMQFKNGGSTAGYQAVSGWIHYDKWSDIKNNHLDLYAWDTTADVIQGSSVRIEDYSDSNNLIDWQKFAIPLVDMGLDNSSIDSLRIAVGSDVGEPLAPDFRLDNIQIEETGGGIQYFAKPETGKLFYVSVIRFTFLGALATTLTDNSVPNIDFEKFFNITALQNGVINQLVRDGQVEVSVVQQKTGDAFKLPFYEIKALTTFNGRTFLSGEATFPSPFLLDGDEDGDYSVVIINDDLTGVGSFQIFLGGIEETKPS